MPNLQSPLSLRRICAQPQAPVISSQPQAESVWHVMCIFKVDGRRRAVTCSASAGRLVRASVLPSTDFEFPAKLSRRCL